MKYKKLSYILVLILMLIIGIDRTYADDSNNNNKKACYYVSDANDLRMKITLIDFGYANEKDMPFWGPTGSITGKVYKIGMKPMEKKFEIINEMDSKTVGDSFPIDGFYSNNGNNLEYYLNPNPECPKYVVLDRNPNAWFGIGEYKAYLTNSENIAKQLADFIDNDLEHYGNYANLQPGMTETKFFEDFTGSDSNSSGEKINPDEFCGSLFGDPNDAGEEATEDSPGRAPSLAYIINKVMGVVRIVVPILIIVLGLLDFGKAVIASKEDEMKKAQLTFIKRVLIGVGVFFVPLLVNVIMGFADLVWEESEYSHCEIEDYTD